MRELEYATDAGPDVSGGVLDPVGAVVPRREPQRADRSRQQTDAVRLRGRAAVAVAAHLRLDAGVVVGACGRVVAAEDRPVAARAATAVALVAVADGIAAAHDLVGRAVVI